MPKSYLIGKKCSLLFESQENYFDCTVTGLVKELGADFYKLELEDGKEMIYLAAELSSVIFDKKAAPKKRARQQNVIQLFKK